MISFKSRRHDTKKIFKFFVISLSFLSPLFFYFVKKNKTKQRKINFTTVVIIIFIAMMWIPIFWLYSFQKKQDNTVRSNCENCNVVLIVIDTLRKDHLPFYGYERNTTPNLSQFAEKSVVFTHNYAASNWTLPAMTSMMTGTYPNHHGVNNKYTYENTELRTSLDNSAPHLITLAEYFEKNGYNTAGFTGGSGVASEAGFLRGFSVYDDSVDFAGFDKTVPLSLAWLKKIERSPINKHFLFLHGYDVHGQYIHSDSVGKYYSKEYNGELQANPAEHIEIRDQSQINQQLFLSAADKEYLINRYDDKIFEMDSKLGEFIDAYTQLNFDRPTIFIITSDHGEEWFDHGGIDHGTTLYQEVVNTPLLIKFPDQENKIVVDSTISAVDLLPTLLDIVGIEKNDAVRIDGTSFKQIIAGNKQQRDAFFHSEYRDIVSLRGGINAQHNKIIVDLTNKTIQLFNIVNDANEQNSINNEILHKNMKQWLSTIFPKVTLLE